MPLDQIIEGVLFFKAEPIKKSVLASLLDVDERTLADATTTLKQRLEDGAIRLIETDTTLMLATAPALDPLIESIRKDELRRDIGKAGAETLAIIAYRGPLERADIDRIRGVNSSSMLRGLLMRGLIEKRHQQNRTLYAATTDLLAHLGISDRTELPDFANILNTLETYELTHTEAE